MGSGTSKNPDLPPEELLVMGKYMLKPRQLDAIRNVFLEADKDHSGQIDLNEFNALFNETSSPFLKHLFVAIGDVSNDGELQFGEFADVVCLLSLMNKADVVRFAFECIDLDGDGTVDGREFGKMMDAIQNAEVKNLSKAQQKVHKFEFAEMKKSAMEEFAKDRDGLLSFEEWSDLTERVPKLLWPLFRLQYHIQQTALGAAFWRKHRADLVEQRLEMSGSCLNCSCLDSGDNYKVKKIYTLAEVLEINKNRAFRNIASGRLVWERSHSKLEKVNKEEQNAKLERRRSSRLKHLGLSTRSIKARKNSPPRRGTDEKSEPTTPNRMFVPELDRDESLHGMDYINKQIARKRVSTFHGNAVHRRKPSNISADPSSDSDGGTTKRSVKDRTAAKDARRPVIVVDVKKGKVVEREDSKTSERSVPKEVNKPAAAEAAEAVNSPAESAAKETKTIDVAEDQPGLEKTQQQGRVRITAAESSGPPVGAETGGSAPISPSSASVSPTPTPSDSSVSGAEIAERDQQDDTRHRQRDRDDSSSDDDSSDDSDDSRRRRKKKKKKKRRKHKEKKKKKKRDKDRPRERGDRHGEPADESDSESDEEQERRRKHNKKHKKHRSRRDKSMDVVNDLDHELAPAEPGDPEVDEKNIRRAEAHRKASQIERQRSEQQISRVASQQSVNSVRSRGRSRQKLVINALLTGSNNRFSPSPNHLSGGEHSRSPSASSARSASSIRYRSPSAQARIGGAIMQMNKYRHVAASNQALVAQQQQQQQQAPTMHMAGVVASAFQAGHHHHASYPMQPPPSPGYGGFPGQVPVQVMQAQAYAQAQAQAQAQAHAHAQAQAQAHARMYGMIYGAAPMPGYIGGHPQQFFPQQAHPGQQFPTYAQASPSQALPYPSQSPPPPQQPGRNLETGAEHAIAMMEKGEKSSVA